MGSTKPCRLIFDSFNKAKVMAGSRRLIELSIKRTELRELESIARSRTEAAGRVERARVLLAYRQDPSFYAVGQALGMHHQKVRRYIERAKADGAMAALDERPRPGKEPTITVEAKTWVVALACRKPKDLGYPHEVWTTRLLAEHAREHGPRQGHACLSGLVQGTVCKILDAQEVKPHKVRYYLERRDPEFKAKMAQVLCVYREVSVLKKAAATKKNKPSKAVTVISYDEKPGIQQSQRPPRTCRPNLACTRASRASLSTSATARSACWPASTLSPARSMPWSRTATAAASSSRFSS
jgi:transposase